MVVPKQLRPTWLIAVFIGVNFVAPARSAPSEAGDAESAWQTVLEQASGPGTQPRDREAAMTAARAHLDKQERTLREFVRSYPDDPHRYSARIRLAAVLASKGRLLSQPALNAEASRLLADLETNPATPPPIRADAGFARVSQSMEEMASRTDSAGREALSKEIRRFDADYPGDRRVAGLLTELATLYDEEPARKKSLLDEAGGRATDSALRQRIADDQRRLALLGHPLALHIVSAEPGPLVDVGNYRGRVTVVLFWASWSLPSLHAMAQLQRMAAEFTGKSVEFVTISLDEDPKALASTVEATGLRWPVGCDGRGWNGDAVRALGVNALPTVWILDRDGNLLTLNARGTQAADLIRKALAR